MQVDLPNLVTEGGAGDHLAKHIRRIYARYGGRLSPFFEQLSRQSPLRKTTSKSQLDPKMREYYERHYRMSAKVKSGEA